MNNFRIRTTLAARSNIFFLAQVNIYYIQRDKNKSPGSLFRVLRKYYYYRKWLKSCWLRPLNNTPYPRVEFILKFIVDHSLDDD